MSTKKDNPRHIGMLSTKCLPHFGTQCYSLTSYLTCILTFFRLNNNLNWSNLGNLE
nr:MAG TPA: hypothetical protein [Caudoviricetes sp.]